MFHEKRKSRGRGVGKSVFIFILPSQLVAARIEPSEYEQSVLKQLSAAAGGAAGEEEEPKRKKKKRPKGPNPLSVKKSTKMGRRRGQGKSGSLSGSGVTSSKVCTDNFSSYFVLLSSLCAF